MKVYAIFPDTLNNSMAVHDMPVDALTKAGVVCEKQEDFFSNTIQKVEKEDIVIMWVGSRDETRLELFSKLNCRKVIRNIDSCSSNRILFKRELEIFDRLGLEGLLVTYCTDFNLKFLSERNIKALAYPHLLDFRKFSVKKPDKIYDVFISGHLSEISYPLRNKLANFFINKRDKYKICFLPHPGYRLTNLIHKVYGQDYINLASQSRTSIVCTGDDDALVVKYLEFAAASTLPIGDAPSNMPDDAKKSMILVSKEMCDAEIELLVDNALRDNEALEQRTKIYQETMKEFFDIEKTPMFLDRLINQKYDNV